MDVVKPNRLEEQERDLGAHCPVFLNDGRRITELDRETLIYEYRRVVAREHKRITDQYAEMGTGSRGSLAVFSQRR